MSTPPDTKAPVVRDEANLQQFVGYKMKKDKYRVKGKNLVAFAEAIGDTNPKYWKKSESGEEKADYSQISAHPAFAAYYIIPGLLMALNEIVDEQGNKLVKSIGKILHTGQEYDYEGCDALTEADKKVVTSGEVKKIWIQNENLWVNLLFTTTNEEGTKTFCRTMVTGIVRKGGF